MRPTADHPRLPVLLRLAKAQQLDLFGKPSTGRAVTRVVGHPRTLSNGRVVAVQPHSREVAHSDTVIEPGKGETSGFDRNDPAHADRIDVLTGGQVWWGGPGNSAQLVEPYPVLGRGPGRRYMRELRGLEGEMAEALSSTQAGSLRAFLAADLGHGPVAARSPEEAAEWLPALKLLGASAPPDAARQFRQAAARAEDIGPAMTQADRGDITKVLAWEEGLPSRPLLGTMEGGALRSLVERDGAPRVELPRGLGDRLAEMGLAAVTDFGPEGMKSQTRAYALTMRGQTVADELTGNILAALDPYNATAMQAKRPTINNRLVFKGWQDPVSGRITPSGRELVETS